MGRRSGGGGGGGYRPPRMATRPSKPATKPSSPAPAANQSGNNGVISAIGNVASNITEGLSWGFGTSIGHRISDFFFGPWTIPVEEKPAPLAAAAALDASSCGIHHKAFADCIGKNGSDISKCQFYMDMLNECRRAGATTMA